MSESNGERDDDRTFWIIVMTGSAVWAAVGLYIVSALV